MYGWGATKYVPDNPCGTVYANMIPSCWGWLNKAVYGDSYTAPPMPPAHPAVDAGTSTVPMPYTLPEYNAALDESIAQQSEEWKALNVEAFRDIDAVVNKSPVDEPWGIPWYWWLAGGLGVFGLIAISAGGPRRYGR